MGGRVRPPASSPTSIALVGFMAVGKTAVGRLAAERMGMRFLDTDALIEERAGDIAGIFASVAETGFRKIERDVVLEVLEKARQEACVVALGGGAVLDGGVREALHGLSQVAWLTAPPSVLWRRVRAADAAARPLARDEAAFARLLDERAPLYAEVASVEILCDGSRPLEAVADAVVSLVRGEPAETGGRPSAVDGRP